MVKEFTEITDAEIIRHLGLGEGEAQILLEMEDAKGKAGMASAVLALSRHYKRCGSHRSVSWRVDLAARVVEEAVSEIEAGMPHEILPETVHEGRAAGGTAD